MTSFVISQIVRLLAKAKIQPCAFRGKLGYLFPEADGDDVYRLLDFIEARPRFKSRLIDYLTQQQQQNAT